MNKPVMIGCGVALIAIAVSVGFVRVDNATWNQWRLVFPIIMGLPIGLGLGLIGFAFLLPNR